MKNLPKTDSAISWKFFRFLPPLIIQHFLATLATDRRHTSTSPQLFSRLIAELIVTPSFDARRDSCARVLQSRSTSFRP